MASRSPPRDTWEQFKEEIRTLYLRFQLPIDRIKVIMQELYDFNASQSQFTRYFHLWNIRKNLRKEDWDAIYFYLQQHELLGNTVLVYHRDHLLSVPKLAKGLSRSPPSTTDRLQWLYGRGPSLSRELSFEIVVPWCCVDGLQREDIPFFQLSDLIKMSFENGKSIPRSSQAQLIIWRALRSAEDNILLCCGRAHISCLSYPRCYSNHICYEFAQKQTDRFMILSLFLSFLDSRLPETFDGETAMLLQSMFELPDIQLQSNLLRIIAYLSSNNFLYTCDLRLILGLITLHLPICSIESFVSIKIPSIEAFADKSLFAAVLLGDIKLVEILLTKGASPYTRERYSATALEMAVQTGNCDLVYLLLRYGRNLIHDRSSTLSSLHIAIDNGFVEMVELLVRAGAAIEYPDNHNLDSSVLVYAIEKKQLGIAKLLVSYGADVNRLSASRIPLGLILPIEVSPLTAGVCIQDIDFVQFLLTKNADVNFQDKCMYKMFRKPGYYTGMTALHAAAYFGSLEILRTLLKAGADPHIMWSSYGTPLRLAASSTGDQIECVRLILAASPLWTYFENCVSFSGNRRSGFRTYCNIDFDIKNLGSGSFDEICTRLMDDASLALHDAAIERNWNVFWHLLGMGLNIQALDNPSNTCFIPSECHTALCSTTAANDIRMVKTLLNLGVNINAKDMTGETALHKAVAGGNEDMVQLLLKEGADVNCSSEYRGTPLTVAIRKKNRELVALLLGHKADVNIPVEGGAMTPLQAASESEDVFLARRLLVLGAQTNPSNTSYDSPSPLQLAAKRDNMELVNLLLDAGADVNAQGQALEFIFEYTALQWAIKNKSLALVLLLLDAGADPNAPGCGQQCDSALNLAVAQNNINIFWALYNAGAKIDPIDSERYVHTALHIAVEEENYEMAQLLLVLGADFDAVDDGWFRTTALHMAVKYGRIKFVRMLLEAGANVNDIRDHEGYTVLQRAIGNGTEIIQILLDYNAHVNAPASELRGKTALQIAALKGKVSETRFLLHKGANVNALPAYRAGATALQYAAFEGHYRIVLMLLRAGANITAPTAPKDGRTALEGAAEHGRLDTVALLLQTASRQGILRKLNIDDAIERATRENHRQIVTLLKRYKDTVDIPDSLVEE